MSPRAAWCAAASALVLGVAAAACLRRNLAVVTVRGPSMEPTYRNGERVLARRGGRPERGQVVVVAMPAAEGAWMIKRVAAVPGDPVPRDRVPALAAVPEEQVLPGMLVLLGDNQGLSHDSRRLGYFPADRVWGTVRRRLSL